MTLDSELLQVKLVDGKAVLTVVSANMDFRNAELLKASIPQLLQEGSKEVLLNLENVSFMDSSGLGVLLYCKRTCDEYKSRFSICGLQSYVENLVKLTSLDKALSVYKTEQDALNPA